MELHSLTQHSVSVSELAKNLHLFNSHYSFPILNDMDLSQNEDELNTPSPGSWYAQGSEESNIIAL